jgi:TPP-dependent pyruvate/acetoin dehydrogenase alpha subunit
MDLQENPLVPNKKLRQMYAAMVEARVLDEHVAGLPRRGRTGKDVKGPRKKGRSRLDSIRGEEACRVSTAIDLGQGDLVSDSQVGVVMELLSGETVDSLLRRVAALHSGKKAAKTKRADASWRLLPRIESAGERLRMAMGAAAAFKTQRQANVVVAYVRQGEIGKGEWRRLLGLASTLELPIIFVILPGGGRDGELGLSAKSAQSGVPGIPVDAGDAVALYRVAQESLGRTRGGDGPVLIECVVHRTKDKLADAALDPLVQMEDFLLLRKVCTKAWLESSGDRIRRRIAAAKQ